MDQRQDDRPPDEKSLQMSVLIAEFNAIRQEIIYRATSQGTLMQGNITATGVLGGLALANHGYAPLLIVLPILSPVLGLLWMDHDASIMKLGTYIRNELKAVCERVAAFKFPDYEVYVKAFPSTGTDIIYFSAAVVVNFGFLPLVALFYVSYVFYASYGRKYLLFAASLTLDVLAFLLLFMFFWRFAKRFWISPFTGVSSDHE